jgi:hypothetical protein
MLQYLASAFDGNPAIASYFCASCSITAARRAYPPEH